MMEPHYTLDVSIQPDTICVTLAGEIDMTAEFALRDRLATVIPATSTATVLINLAEVTFLDSAGISLLLHIRRAALAAGATCRLLGAHGPPAAVLEITAVGDLFTACGISGTLNVAKPEDAPPSSGSDM